MAELHFTLETRRAGGRKDSEPAAPDIQSACAPCHDPLGTWWAQDPLHSCPWPSTALGPCQLLGPKPRAVRPVLSSPQYPQWEAEDGKPVGDVLCARPVLDTSTEGHLLLPPVPLSRGLGRRRPVR